MNKNILKFILLIYLVISFVLNIISFLKFEKQHFTSFTYERSTKNSPWIEYRNTWNMEVLIDASDSSKEIQFTDKYRDRMRGKGLHPLNTKHARLLERFLKMETYCNLNPPLNNSRYNVGVGYDNVLFNDEFELLQCMVPKASSTTWLEMFIKMFGEDVQFEIYLPPSHLIWNNISLVNNLDRNITAKRYQTYTKFLITRNPFERLLSAYKSKFTLSWGPYEEEIGPQIIRVNYLSDIPEYKIKKIKKELKNEINMSRIEMARDKILQIKRMDAGLGKLNITFLEFLNYVISQSKTFGRERFDHHWAPITSICNPCAIRYVILAKFETLSEDSQAILDYVQAKHNNESINFPTQEPQVNSIKCRKEFEKIPIDVRNSLYQIFKEDYLSFGYQYNELEDLFC